MADLRIVDAPVLLQESITDDVKMPTGGLGNFSIRLGDIVRYVVAKEQLANKNYVDLSSKGVKDSLDEHIADKDNPHQVTKAQVGLGNVDNTADVDKPVSNATKSAITIATTDMATKAYVNSKDGDLTTLTTNDKTNLVKAVNEIHDVSVKNGTYAPVLGSPVKLMFDASKFSLRYGLSDPLPLDNNTNMFRGLTNKDAWADENIGAGSVALGRNGASVAYLSTTFGHDCITYGVASTAGGAGSGTGNPDAPTDGANYGYCSFAHGKDTAAIGRISTAFGQNNVAGTVHSFAAGFESKTGKGSSTHPVLSGTAIDDNGDCAFTHGFRAFAYGNYSAAIGNFVRAYHGSKVIGSGINPGSLLEGLVPKSIVLGSGVDIPTIILTEGDVVANGAFGKVGFNTKYKPRERVEVVIKDGDKIAIRSSNNTAQGGGTLDLQGTLGDGKSASIFRIEYNSPNSGQAYGRTDFYQNNQNWLSLNESGDPTFKKPVDSMHGYRVDDKRVVGGQQSAIANSTGTAADNARAINAILAAMRGHGLIAS